MNDDRPISTIEETWRLCDACDRTALAGKAKQNLARAVALWLGVVGAFLGTVAGLDWTFRGSEAIPLVAAVCIAVAGYFCRELLTQDRESEWARARILAEALKREVWRCLMRVPPYEGGLAGEVLKERADGFLSNTGLNRESVNIASEPQAPRVNSVEDYIKERAAYQMQWYETKADKHRTALKKLTLLTFLIGTAAVVLGVIGSAYGQLLGFVPVATTATAAILAWLQAGRLASMVNLYQAAATQLRLHLAAWKDAASSRAKLSSEDRHALEVDLVQTCENIMARENESWRAEWLSKESVKRAIDAMTRAHEAAKNAAQGEAGRQVYETEKSAAQGEAGSHPAPPIKLSTPPRLCEKEEAAEESSAAESDAGGFDRYRFSSFYPEKVGPDTVGKIVAYAHLESVAAGEVAADALGRLELPRDVPVKAGASEPISVPPQSVIRVTPDIPGLVFDSTEATMSLWEDMQAVEFRFKPDPKATGSVCKGWVNFWLEGMLLAGVPVTVFVSPDQVPGFFRDAIAEAHAKPYRRVFPSYSHEDADIVTRLATYATSFGDEYLRDVHALRAGQTWKDELMLFIEQADVFQLFWSQNAAASRCVREEWQRALQERKRRPDPYYLRPVYWTPKPIPSPPRELRELHFARISV